MTEEAVRRFQARHGIVQVGILGPQTRTALNVLLNSTYQSELNTYTARKAEEVQKEQDLQKLQKREESKSKEQEPQSPLESPTPQKPTTPTKPPETGDYSQQYTLFPKPTYDLKDMAHYAQIVVNDRRIEAGLKPLKWDATLAEMARLHSQDQADDNERTTDPNLHCQYPLIRHEGFSFGYSLGDRLNDQQVPFRSAGENIAILPETKNTIYQFRTDQRPPECPDVEIFTPGEGTKTERTELLSKNTPRIAGCGS